MFVAYHWKLNENLIWENPDLTDYIRVLEDHEFPRTKIPYFDALRISEMLPWKQFRECAIREVDLASRANNAGRFEEALAHYQQCLQVLERFRDPAVFDLASECYLASGRCAMANGKAATCLSFLRQHFLIAEATPESIELKRIAKEQDASTLRQIELLTEATKLTLDDVKPAVDYLVEYPLPGRAALAKKILKCVPRHNENEAELLWYLGRCHMAEGQWQEAYALLVPLASINALIRKHLDRWQGLLHRGHGAWTPKFGTTSADADVDVTDAVNHGLTFLANALYHDAREWFLFALEKAPHDPFALFGHGLFLWRQGWFCGAAEQLKLARDALETYPAEFRFVTFGRIDETCEPRSYAFNSLYPIFNIADCIERVVSREPFVSYALIP